MQGITRCAVSALVLPAPAALPADPLVLRDGRRRGRRLVGVRNQVVEFDGDFRVVVFD